MFSVGCTCGAPVSGFPFQQPADPATCPNATDSREHVRPFPRHQLNTHPQRFLWLAFRLLLSPSNRQLYVMKPPSASHARSTSWHPLSLHNIAISEADAPSTGLITGICMIVGHIHCQYGNMQSISCGQWRHAMPGIATRYWLLQSHHSTTNIQAKIRTQPGSKSQTLHVLIFSKSSAMTTPHMFPNEATMHTYTPCSTP